jgi:hypothetical protein
MAALTLAAGVKASASQDQARQSSTCDGAGNHANTRDSVVETVPSRLLIAVPHRPAAII